MKSLVSAIFLTGSILMCASSSPAAAQSTYSGIKPASMIQDIPIFLGPNQTVTLSTAGNTPSSTDPVMFLMSGNTQRAYSDDVNGLNPQITFTNPLSYSTVYSLIVFSYSESTAGRANIVKDGVVIATQAAIGGYKVSANGWASGLPIRNTGVSRDQYNSPVLIVMSGYNAIHAVDSISGPGINAQVTPSIASTPDGSVRWGQRGTGQSLGHLSIPRSSLDQDSDGIRDGMETAIGTSPTNADSDGDSIPDGVEFYGINQGYDFSKHRGNSTATNALVKNVYVEVDYMNGSGTNQNKLPYANLVADANSVFQSDGASRLEVIVSNAVPFSQVINYGPCGTIPNCVNFYNLKSQHSLGWWTDTYAKQYVHYAVFANQYWDPVDSIPSCSSGNAEIFGNDLFVTLAPQCNFSSADELGTFIHELGHNLNLVHNGNDDNDHAKDSVVHNSVMNYRYQFAGISGRTGATASTYSGGAGGCAPCATSPKNSCAAARSAGTCAANPNCDCDVNEWGGAVRYDTPTGGEFADGSGSNSAGRGAPVSISPAQLDTALLEARVQKISAASRNKVALQLGLGRKINRDFTVSADGEHLFAVER